MFSRCRKRNRGRDSCSCSLNIETRNQRSGFDNWISPLASQLAALAIVFCSAGLSYSAERELRVCADPNNLPFSNQRGEGFENRIADLIAREFGAKIHYTWWAQRRGFVRSTLRQGLCDLIIGVPAGYDPVLTTRSYYRSTYVFVSRRDQALALTSLDDPRLRKLKIGVHLIGDDGANAPPAHALSRRGMITNVIGYPIYGDYSEPNPPARLIDAVANGLIDVALAWGPLAGYFSPREPVPLEIAAISPAADPPGLRFAFGIAMGVRKQDVGLRDELNRLLDRRRQEIQKILEEFGVPQVAEAER